MKKILQGALKLSPVAIIGYVYCSNQLTQEDKTTYGLKEFKGFKSRK